MSWKSCTSCRKDIDFLAPYWECSVSTCNRKRMGLFFCSVACWDAHLPEARHREAWAVEKKSPSKESWERESEDSRGEVATPSPKAEAPRRRVISAASDESNEDLPKDVLIVVSKLKKYIKAKSDLKTSEGVVAVLSDEIRRICDRSIRVAREKGQKTVMDRDVREALKSDRRQ